MEQRNYSEKKSFYIILILALTTLVFVDVINRQMLFIFGMICWSYIYIYNKKNYNIEFALVKMLILSVPLSFKDVFGQSYDVSSLSWFNIFLFLMIVVYIFKYVIKGRAYFNYISLLSIFLIILSIVPTLLSEDIRSGFNQYVNIIVVFILIIIGNSFKYNLTMLQKDVLKKDYISSTIIASIGTALQIFFVKGLGIIIGNYAVYGGSRYAYGFLFADYSFLSLYLVSGAIMIYFSKEKSKKSKKKIILNISFLLLTSILTSARTGITTFVLIIAPYGILKSLHLLKKGSINSILLLVLNTVIIIPSYFLVGMMRNSRFSDSGRNSINYRAYSFFLENPLLGIGFGENVAFGMTPHNIIFQYLLQGGLIYAIPIAIFLLILLWESYKKDTSIFSVLICIILGSLFIPSIFSSRFLPVIVLLLSFII